MKSTAPKYRRSIRWIGLLVAMGLVPLWVSCAFTTKQTPRQLECGEWVFSAGLDVPGGLDDYEPYFSWGEARVGTTRVGVQAMYGIAGHGDVGVHGGATLNAFNVGATGRYYVDDWLTAAVQTDYVHQLDMVTVTPRLTTATSDDRWYYGGLQTNLFFGVAGDERFMTMLGGTTGFVGGVEYYLDGWRFPLGLQAEAIVSPFYFGRGHGAGLFVVDEETPGLYQIGVGVNLRY